MTKFFQDSVGYCMISTRIEDAMAMSPLIADDQRKELDEALTEWFRTSSVHDNGTNEPARIMLSKNVLRWRYRLSRIILHRPLLLLHAMRKTNRGGMTSHQIDSIETCRKAGGELITDIATTWQGQKACQFSGTHAAWILYQAAMVPLLSMFSDYRDADIVADCSRQVEVAKAALLDLQPWSLMAKQCLESVRLLHEASRRYSAQQQSQPDPHSTLTQWSNASAQLSPDGGSLHDLDICDGTKHDSLSISSHDQFFSNDILDNLYWYTDWDSMDYVHDLQHAE